MEKSAIPTTVKKTYRQSKVFPHNECSTWQRKG